MNAFCIVKHKLLHDNHVGNQPPTLARKICILDKKLAISILRMREEAIVKNTLWSGR